MNRKFSIAGIVSPLLAVVALCASSAGQDAPREALYLAGAGHDGEFALLHGALEQRHGYRVHRARGEGDLLQELGTWANQIRVADPPPCCVLMYCQTDLAQAGDKWCLNAEAGSIDLADVLKKLALASQNSAGVLILETPDGIEQLGTLETEFRACKAKGPLAVIVVRSTNSDPLTPAIARLLRAGSAAPAPTTPSLDVSAFVALLKHQFPEQVACAVNHSTALRTVLTDSRPRVLDELLVDLADEVGSRLTGRPHDLLLIPDASFGEGQSPLLARSATARFRTALAARGDCRVFDSDQLRGWLHAASVRTGPVNWSRIAEQVAHLAPDPVVVQLHLKTGPGPAEIAVSCELLRPLAKEDRPLEIHGAAVLTPTEWGLTGQSVITKGGVQAIKPLAERLQPATLATIDFNRPSDVQTVLQATRELEARSLREPHPLSNPAFPYRLELRVQGRPAPIRFSADKRRQYVQLARGDRFTIGVANKHRQPVFVRLLVDGLNTLPDFPLVEKQGQGNDVYEVAVKDQQRELAAAQYALLHNARAWYCEPASYEVRGFFTKIDKPGIESFSSLVQGERARFVVTDASASEAAQRSYTKDVGIVTAAIFSAVDDPVLKKAIGPRFGTRLGERATENVQLYTGNLVPGDLLAVIHLHYGFDTSND